MTSQCCPPFNSRETYITLYISTFYFPTFFTSFDRFITLHVKFTTRLMSMSLSGATVSILELMHLVNDVNASKCFNAPN